MIEPVSRTRKKRKWVSAAINIFLLGFLALMIFSPSAKGWILSKLFVTGLFNASIEKTRADAIIPAAFDLRDSTGKSISTRDFYGKKVFINFWASWCPPCRAEMPSMIGMYNDLKADTNIVFVFISQDEDAGKAEAYLSANNFRIPQFTTSSTIPTTIYTGRLPTTVVLDTEGKLIYRHESMADYNTEAFKQLLRSSE